MTEFFKDIKFDWMGKRKMFIFISIFVMLAGLVSAVSRELIPGGTHSFNLGVDFKGGTVVTGKFKQKPADDDIRAALQKNGINDAVIQSSTNKPDEVLIKIPLIETAETEATQTEQPNENVIKEQVQSGRQKVKTALDTFGKEAEGEATLDSSPDFAYKIIGTDSVGAVAGSQLRNQAVAATLLGLVGILLFIAFRYDWTYAAGAVIAVFHDVLMVLGCFSIFQWEINLTVIAAVLTIVGFSVNDSIVIFDRVRENLADNRTDSLYNITNQSINQTLSRTIITSGLVLLSVLALVVFGGEVLFSFSIALLIGVTFGTYSTVAIASPIAIWWEDKIGSAKIAKTVQVETKKEDRLASASRRSVKRRTV
jgi:preprotein translocase subunit SecF